jgi:hypothetical protein
VRAACPRPLECRLCPRPELPVLGDQRAVEVEGEGVDSTREVRRELYGYGAWPPVEFTTYAATSAICCVLSCVLNEGMPGPPFVTWEVTAR